MDFLLKCPTWFYNQPSKKAILSQGENGRCHGMKKSSQRPLPPGIHCVSKKCSVPHPYVGITQIRWGRGNHPPLSPLSENSLADRLHVFPVQDLGKNTASRHGAWSGQGALLTGRDAHWNKMKHNELHRVSNASLIWNDLFQISETDESLKRAETIMLLFIPWWLC